MGKSGKMNSTLSLLLVFMNQFFMPRHNAQLRLPKAQITILRACIPTQRIILSPAETAELLRIGEECGHDIDGLLDVARPATYSPDAWWTPLQGRGTSAPDAGIARRRHPHWL
jgi:putative transposase